MAKDYNESRQRIEEKHGAELSRVSEVARRKKEEFGHLAGRVMKPLNARIKKLDVDENSIKDPQKLWNRQGRFLGGLEENLTVRPLRPAKGRQPQSRSFRLPPLNRSPRL
jgi:hypothetical protein